MTVISQLKQGVRAAALGLLAFVTALSAMPVNPSHAAGQAGKKYIAIGTGGPTGVYFIAGNAICSLLRKSTKSIRCSAPSTGGSIYNIEAIRRGDLDMGVVQSDWQHHAFNGSSKFEGRRFDRLRSLFSIYPEAFQLVVGKDSGIKSWADLKGKKVNIGNVGSGQRATFEALMIARNIDGSYFGEVFEMDSSEHTQALCAGKIDAYGYMVGVPSEDIASAAKKCGARLIPVTGEAVNKLLADSSFYAATKIAKGTYATSNEAVNTFGVMSTMVASVDADENTVYQLVKAVFDNIDLLRKMHPAFAHLDPKKMIIDGLSAPLHPGAARYYKEKGWIK